MLFLYPVFVGSNSTSRSGRFRSTATQGCTADQRVDHGYSPPSILAGRINRSGRIQFLKSATPLEMPRLGEGNSGVDLGSWIFIHFKEGEILTMDTFI